MSKNQPEWLSIVREKVETLRYGVVQIVIHDSKVTLIERTEKTRMVGPGTESISNRPDNLEDTNSRRALYRTTGERS